MHPDNLPKRHGKQPVRVIVAQILLHRKRQPPQIIQGIERIVIDLQFIEFLPVKRHMGADPVEGGLQPLQLQLLQVFPGQTFFFLFPKHSGLYVVDCW